MHSSFHYRPRCCHSLLCDSCRGYDNSRQDSSLPQIATARTAAGCVPCPGAQEISQTRVLFGPQKQIMEARTRCCIRIIARSVPSCLHDVVDLPFDLRQEEQDISVRHPHGNQLFRSRLVARSHLESRRAERRKGTRQRTKTSLTRCEAGSGQQPPSRPIAQVAMCGRVLCSFATCRSRLTMTTHLISSFGAQCLPPGGGHRQRQLGCFHSLVA